MAGDPVEFAVGAPRAPEVETGPTDSAKPATSRRPRRDSMREAGMPAAPDPFGEPAPLVDERQVRGLCKSLSGVLSALVGDPDVDRHWRFTDDELDELVPPLTRYINRTPRLLVAVEKGNELEIALVLAGWAGRNITDGQRAREVRRERQRETEGAGPGAADVPGPASGGRPVAVAHGVAGPGADGGGPPR